MTKNEPILSQSETRTVVEQIKAEIDFVSFLARYTNGLKPSGKGFFVGRCPFHQPQTDPKGKRKFWVSKRGICGCFVPRCQEQQPKGLPMDIINFWARYRDLSNREAIEDLTKMAGIFLDRD